MLFSAPLRELMNTHTKTSATVGHQFAVNNAEKNLLLKPDLILAQCSVVFFRYSDAQMNEVSSRHEHIHKTKGNLV